MPKLVFTEGDETTEHELGEEPLTIGRSSECDIRLSDPSVSRLHAVVEVSGDTIEVRDQESRSGIRVNGSEVTDGVLRDGDELRVGKVVFKAVIKAAPAPPRRSSRRSAAGADGAPGGDEGAETRSTRRVQREILGGAKLSKRQQTLIKIVCAAIIVLTWVFFIFILPRIRRWWRSRGRGPRLVERTIFVNPTDEPKRLLSEATDLHKRGREAELAGRTIEAHRLTKEAKDKIERAQVITDELGMKYPGPGYGHIHKLASAVNQKAQAIRLDEFRLGKQVERDRAKR